MFDSQFFFSEKLINLENKNSFREHKMVFSVFSRTVLKNIFRKHEPNGPFYFVLVN